MSKKLRVVSLFSGIGAFEKGLSNVGIDYELVGFSEIDKYAIEAYCAIHDVGKNYNLGDISKVQDLGKFDGSVDLIVGGSPCQDFSIAGKQQGSTFECLDCGHEFNPLVIHYTKRNECPNCNSINLEKTRSSLLIEYLRTIREIKPKYFIYENVKNIVGKKFKDAFDLFEGELKEYGYNTYWQVLNAKDYGVPQNRERVFVIGIRKDIDDGKFEFPEGFDNGLRLKDFLLDVVEDRYYIDNDRANTLISRIKGGIKGHYPNIQEEPLSSSALSSREHRAAGWSEGIGTLCARDYKDPKVIAEPIRTIDGRGDKRVIEKTPNAIQILEVKQLVRVRKYEVDIENLTTCLRECKTQSKLTNRQISEQLNKSITLVEHWFRRDSSFAIPDVDVWYKLKELLGIKTDEFDKSITEFEEKEGVYEKGNRYYHEEGIAPTLTTSANERIIASTNEPKRLGGLFDTESKKRQAGAVWDKDYIAPTIDTCQGGYRELSIIEQPKVAVREATKKGYAIATVGDSINFEQPNSKTRRGRVGKGVANTLTTSCNQGVLEPVSTICAMRGRYNDDGEIEQQLEIQKDKISNSLTTVQKDNMVLEPDYRIRKLTPLECWRLMGFNDDDYYIAKQALENEFYKGKDRSNSQMYKMAGNSICVNVLEEIFKNLLHEYIN